MQTALKLRSRWLAARYAASDPRWRTASQIKLRQQPYCQVRVRCAGAEAKYISPISWSLAQGSLLNPDNLQSTCPACYQWKAAISTLRVHA